MSTWWSVFWWFRWVKTLKADNFHALGTSSWKEPPWVNPFIFYIATLVIRFLHQSVWLSKNLINYTCFIGQLQICYWRTSWEVPITRPRQQTDLPKRYVFQRTHHPLLLFWQITCDPQSPMPSTFAMDKTVPGSGTVVTIWFVVETQAPKMGQTIFFSELYNIGFESNHSPWAYRESLPFLYCVTLWRVCFLHFAPLQKVFLCFGTFTFQKKVREGSKQMTNKIT